MKQLLDQQMISGLEGSQSDNTFTCDACIQAKIAQIPLPKESREHAKKWVIEYILTFGGCQDIKPLTRNFIMFLSLMTTQESNLSYENQRRGLSKIQAL